MMKDPKRGIETSTPTNDEPNQPRRTSSEQSSPSEEELVPVEGELLSPKEKSPCNVCVKILGQFDAPQLGKRIKLDVFSDIVHGECQRLLHELRNFVEPWEERRLGSTIYHKYVYLTSEKDGSFCFSFHGRPVRVLLVHKENASAPRLTGRSYGGDVDTGLLKQWVSICATQHKSRCHNPLQVDHTEPFWLIDTHSNSLASGHKKRFVALSYRWANSACLQTTKANLALLRQMNGLNSPELAQKIPATVRDAIKLVKELGERYLWVDALCIVQDDSSTKLHEIHNMAAIYANAKFTIVAADGNATTGLIEYEGTRDWRREYEGSLSFHDYTVVGTRFSSLEETRITSEYSQRGWTFQEYHMSARRLIFYEGIAHWECSCAIWHEDREPSTHLSQTRHIYSLGRMLNGLPSIPDYINLVNSFTVRHLTYDKDALPALSGILTVLSRTFEGGFLFGLPEMYFDMALLWEVPGHRRRQRMQHDETGSLVFPSWTWLGWQGEITFHTGMKVDGSSSQPPRRIIPITQWYAHDTPHGTPKRPIHSTWYEYRRKFEELKDSLPPGWVNHDLSARGYPTNCFTHPSTEDVFSYPINFRDEENKASLPISRSTMYISCQTYMSRLYVYEVWKEDVVLVEASGLAIGHLWTHDGDIPLPSAPVLEEGSPVDIVLVTGLAKNGLEIDHYYVIWVEWVDGVAYRKGLGEVKRFYWDSQTRKPERINLVLG